MLGKMNLPLSLFASGIPTQAVQAQRSITEPLLPARMTLPRGPFTTSISDSMSSQRPPGPSSVLAALIFPNKLALPTTIGRGPLLRGQRVYGHETQYLRDTANDTS